MGMREQEGSQAGTEPPSPHPPPWYKVIFEPNRANVLVVLGVILAFLYFFFSFREPPLSPLSLMLMLIVSFSVHLAGSFGAVMSVVLIYALICLLVYVAKATYKKNKILFAMLIVFFVISTGIEQPLVNSTINQPDYRCEIDSDCAVKTLSDSGFCPHRACVNKDWNLYSGGVPSVWASCSMPQYFCTCEENRCVTNDIEEVMDAKFCSEVESDWSQDECYIYLVNNTGNRSHCWGISNAYRKVGCLGLTKEDLEYCDIIYADPSDIDHLQMCYVGVAGAHNDEDLCRAILYRWEDTMRFTQCLIAIGATPESCYLIKEYFNMTDRFMPAECYYSVGKHTPMGIEKFCNETQHPNVREWCAESNMGTSQELIKIVSEEACEAINATKIFYKGSCYKDLAVLKQDIKYCLNATGFTGACAAGVDVNKTIPLEELEALCAAASWSPEDCYKDIAMHKNEVLLCQKAGRYAVECAMGADTNKTAPIEELDTVCATVNVNLSWYRPHCYKHLGWYRKEPALCEKAGDLRDKCMAEIS